MTRDSAPGALWSSFIIDSRSPRVVFGAGSRMSVATEAERLGLTRVLLISTRGRAPVAAEIERQLGSLCVGAFPEARPHVPRAGLEEARARAGEVKADGYVTVGGGSAIGYAKALALDSGSPILALPTTYAGSEATPIWGVTDGDTKKTGRSWRVLPKTVIYDPELTVQFPPRFAGPSGINAIAHCVEALYAPDANPLTSLVAAEGLRVLSRSLPVVTKNPTDLAARTAAMYGSYLGGLSLGGATMGIHHRLCHMLGGTFGLPHADTHAVLLPHVVAYKSDAAGADRIARTLRSRNAARELHALCAAVGAPASLREIGLAQSELPRAIQQATELTDGGDRLPLNVARRILENAFHGMPPAAAA